MAAEQITEAQPLLATEADGTGLFEIQIITPGVGSSGVYPAEVLEAAVRDRIWPQGLHLYVDHPTEAEQMERPERSVRDLAGALVEDAQWDPARQAVTAKARVYSMYRPLVKEAAQDIGVSIRASAEVHEGMYNGQPARMVDRLVEGYSVDFVTHAGRGGAVLNILESERNRLLADTQTVPAVERDTTTQGEVMPEISEADKALTDAQDRVAALEAERDQLIQRAETAEADRDKAIADLAARDLKDAALNRAAESVKDLPEAMATRILNGIINDLPVTDQGGLDEIGFDARLGEAIKAEQDYAAAVTPKGITGFGTSTQAETIRKADRVSPWGREIKEA